MPEAKPEPTATFTYTGPDQELNAGGGLVFSRNIAQQVTGEANIKALRDLPELTEANPPPEVVAKAAKKAAAKEEGGADKA